MVRLFSVCNRGCFFQILHEFENWFYLFHFHVVSEAGEDVNRNALCQFKIINNQVILSV